MIRVEHDWWKTLFDEVYLVTDAPFVCNPALTKREVDVIEKALGLQFAARILDVCGGQGRHALELARRGYQHLAVLDYSDFLLDRGRWEAAASGVNVTFCQGDARAMPLPTASFDVFCHPGATGAITIGKGHVGAFFHKQPHRCLTNARGTAGHCRHLAIETSHLAPLARRRITTAP